MPHTIAHGATSSNPILDTLEANREKQEDALEAVRVSMEESRLKTAAAVDAAEATVTDTAAAAEVIQQTLPAIAEAAQVTKLSSDIAQMTAQNVVIDSIGAAGSPESQRDLMTALTEDQSRVTKLEDQLRDTQDDTPTGIGFIDAAINQIRSTQTAVQLFAAKAEVATSRANISSISQASESFAVLNNNLKRTLNEGVIQANQDIIALKAVVKGAEAKRDNAWSNASAVLQSTRASAAEVTNRLAVVRLLKEKDAIELQREQNKITREKMAAERKLAPVRLKQAEVTLAKSELDLADSVKLGPVERALRFDLVKKARADLDKEISFDTKFATDVQIGQSLAGIPIEEIDFILSAKELSAENERKYILLQEIGGVGDGTLADNPYEADRNLTFVSPSGKFKATPGTEALEAISVEQIREYAKLNKIPKDEATRKADFNTTAKLFMETKAQSIVTGDATNPYQSIPFNLLLELSDAIKNDKLYKSVLKAHNMQEINPQTIKDHAIAGIRAGAVTAEEAATGIEIIFDAAANHNNTHMGGFRRYGLLEQDTYNTPIKREFTTFEQLAIVGQLAVTLAPGLVTGGLVTTGDAPANLVKSAVQKATNNIDYMDFTLILNDLTTTLTELKPPPAE